MAQQANRDTAAHRLRERLSQIRGEIDRECDYREFGATWDYEYRMSDARLKALRVERDHLKEILGDL